MTNRYVSRTVGILTCALGVLLCGAASAAEPVGGAGRTAPTKAVPLAVLLGPGDFQVAATGKDWVDIKNLATKRVTRYRMGAGGEFDTGRKIKVTKEAFTNAGGTGADLNCGSCEKRCTLISTGSSPGPEDDQYSCHCISSDGRQCG